MARILSIAKNSGRLLPPYNFMKKGYSKRLNLDLLKMNFHQKHLILSSVFFSGTLIFFNINI